MKDKKNREKKIQAFRVLKKKKTPPGLEPRTLRLEA
jgi:hypothetical protein